ncbi:MAG: tryptophan synthase subunit alpha, partial [Thermoleophilia bacterium]|nr:tryptophan synthase subunit alpha [Thermoleophilia bacterium]
AGRKALVPYLSAGYPDRAAFRRLLRATADAGCDVVEVGVPFSDPVADGPVIQAAGHAALAGGATLRTALDDAGEHAAATGASVVLMTYLNPVLRLGLDAFVDAAADAGLAGVILPDVPREESAQARAALRGRGLAGAVAAGHQLQRHALLVGGAHHQAEGFTRLQRDVRHRHQPLVPDGQLQPAVRVRHDAGGDRLPGRDGQHGAQRDVTLDDGLRRDDLCGGNTHPCSSSAGCPADFRPAPDPLARHARVRAREGTSGAAGKSDTGLSPRTALSIGPVNGFHPHGRNTHC